MHAGSLYTIIALIRQIEATILGLRQLRGYVASELGRHMLDALIEEAEAGLVEIKRTLVQVAEASVVMQDRNDDEKYGRWKRKAASREPFPKWRLRFATLEG
jgi:hypothetical protein